MHICVTALSVEDRKNTVKLSHLECMGVSQTHAIKLQIESWKSNMSMLSYSLVTLPVRLGQKYTGVSFEINKTLVYGCWQLTFWLVNLSMALLPLIGSVTACEAENCHSATFVSTSQSKAQVSVVIS